MPFDLLTVLPTRLDVEVNGFNGGVLNGVPSAYHWYTEQYGVKWPVGYEVNISRQGKTSFKLGFRHAVVSAGKQRCCRIKPPFRLHAGALVRRTGAAISVAGSDMSVESLLMCCGGTGMVFPDR